MKRLRVLLIDDCHEFLMAVEYFLKRDARFEVIGWAATGSDGQADAEKLVPDVVLMELVMPVIFGAESIRRIKALPNAPRVIVLTMHDYSEYRIVAKYAGADGFLHKADIGKQLLPLIEKVLGIGNG